MPFEIQVREPGRSHWHPGERFESRADADAAAVKERQQYRDLYIRVEEVPPYEYELAKAATEAEVNDAQG